MSSGTNENSNIVEQAQELVTALLAYVEKTKQGAASRHDYSEYRRNAYQLNTLLELRNLPGVNMSPTTALELSVLEERATQAVLSVETNPRVILQKTYLSVPFPIALGGALVCIGLVAAYGYFIH